jgi:uncharacterized protein DUF2637
MSDYSVVRGSRSGDPHLRLRLAALSAVIVGVLVVAAAAFLLSYNGIHQIALQAGVSSTLARLYPVMFDAMLVIACSAALALRSAGWPTRLYVWLSLLVLLGAVATGDALYAMSISLPVQPAQAVVAIIPWVLLLMSFVMLLLMLRHRRKVRAAAGGEPAGRAADGAAAGPGTATWAASPDAAAGRAGAPPATIDSLLGPRADRAPARDGSAAGPVSVDGPVSVTGPVSVSGPVSVAGRGAPDEEEADGTAYAGELDKPREHPWAEEHAGTGEHPWAEEHAGTGEHPWAEEHAGTGENAGTSGTGENAGSSGTGAQESTRMPGAGTGDVEGEGAASGQASPPPMMPAPTPVPHFDRMHSTPTPPQEPDAEEE